MRTSIATTIGQCITARLCHRSPRIVTVRGSVCRVRCRARVCCVRVRRVRVRRVRVRCVRVRRVRVCRVRVFRVEVLPSILVCVNALDTRVDRSAVCDDVRARRR